MNMMKVLGLAAVGALLVLPLRLSVPGRCR